MHPILRKAPLAAALGAITITTPIASAWAEKQAVLDQKGVHHLPEFAVPPSPLSSEEYRLKLIERGKAATNAREAGAPQPVLELSTPEAILRVRARADAARRTNAERMLTVFPATVRPEIIGGVQTDVVMPEAGIAPRNRERVLINLHGGGMMFGARWEGQVASIPISSLGQIKVITVDYRMAPEHRYPAAEDDVVAVYRELLNTYRPENIGIYGHSAGAYLTAAVFARIVSLGLSRPGALSLDGGGATNRDGDSAFLAGAFLFGIPDYPPSETGVVEQLGLYFENADMGSPLVSPADHENMIRQFPPTLIMNAMRDPTLSRAVYTHRQLVRAGVETELHVWDGLPHSFHYDPSLPESRESYRVLIRFFDKHLGSDPR